MYMTTTPQAFRIHGNVAMDWNYSLSGKALALTGLIDPALSSQPENDFLQ